IGFGKLKLRTCESLFRVGGIEIVKSRSRKAEENKEKRSRIHLCFKLISAILKYTPSHNQGQL
ncbi:hypothetical protein L873DRAFT_1928306, partial [Choiromyces venosus 120613-1]